MKEKGKMSILAGGIHRLWNAYRIQAFVLSSHGTLHFGGRLMLLLAYFLLELEAGGLINVLPWDQCWNAKREISVHCKASTRVTKHWHSNRSSYYSQYEWKYKKMVSVYCPSVI